MIRSIIKLLIGDLDDKRAYRQLMKRVHNLPNEYRYAFRRIRHYMYTVGPVGGDLSIFTDLTMFTNLVELFEISAAEGRRVLDVIGSDVSRFSDEFMSASGNDKETMREKLNNEVKEKFSKEGQ